MGWVGEVGSLTLQGVLMAVVYGSTLAWVGVLFLGTPALR